MGQSILNDKIFGSLIQTEKGINEIIKQLEPYIKKLASKTYHTLHSYDDICQLLRIRLWEGIKAFKPEKGKPFCFLKQHLKYGLLQIIDDQSNIKNQYCYNIEHCFDTEEDNNKSYVPIKECSYDPIDEYIYNIDCKIMKKILPQKEHAVFEHYVARKKKLKDFTESERLSFKYRISQNTKERKLLQDLCELSKKFLNKSQFSITL